MAAVTGPNQYGPLSLAYFEQVYWRVDGVSADSGTVEHAGFVWTFRTLIDPAWASNPDPADGATDVDVGTSLSWTPGAGATGHIVYLGADDPANMVQVAGPLASTTYDPPGSLDLGTTYYWRIVESPGMGEGLTWSFTTSNYRVVDDMESYTPWTMPGNNIFEAYRDGMGNCEPGNGNGTGANLNENADPVYVLGGLQSMKYDYDNDGMVYNPCTTLPEARSHYYSEIEAQVADLASGIGTDWTASGVKALRINFMGLPGNSATEPFWVQLQDGSKTYGTKVSYGDNEGESLDHLAQDSWHEWNIDLGDFNVDLTNVVSIVIGIGTEGATMPGGSGTIYIDDIRLYAPTCVPARCSAAFALVNYGQDCVVDYRELEIMAGNWLTAPGTVPNGDFELVYKPGEGTTGAVSPGGWTMGVGPDCPIDSGSFDFDDGTTGSVADIPGWVGYDVQGWLDMGGTYCNNRDCSEAGGNQQGSVSPQHQYTGAQCYLANGGGWGNAAGGLIVSDASLGSVKPGTYFLSMMANGNAEPVVLELLVDDVVMTPTSEVSPAVSGEWQEYSRTYDSLPSGELKIVLGLGRPDPGGATGNQSHFDNVRLSHSEDEVLSFKDFAGLAVWWLDEQLWPLP
jgi:hypothetical protein